MSGSVLVRDTLEHINALIIDVIGSFQEPLQEIANGSAADETENNICQSLSYVGAWVKILEAVSKNAMPNHVLSVINYAAVQEFANAEITGGVPEYLLKLCEDYAES